MSLDVGKSIKELLFEHSVVIVPGLGGFTSSPSPATIDYVQGMVLPPSKKIEFNPNLVINDGVLVNYIQKGNTVTFQEAGDAVSRYVDEVNQALERREIVEIAQVGRLYKDYEHKIRFMPEGVNFNADSFGLPAVQFTPLVKERNEAATNGVSAVAEPPRPAATAAAATTPASPSPPSGTVVPPVGPQTSVSGWGQRLLPWLVLLAAVLLALSIYFMFGGKDKTAEPVAKERLNVKPQVGEDVATTEEPGAAAEKPTAKEPEKAVTPAPPAASKEQPAAPEKKTPPTNGLQQVFIVVHSFGVRSNATKFAQKLSESGYSAETQKVGALYRVGVMLPYKNDAEVQSMKNELGKKFNAKPKTEKELDEQGL